MGQLKSSTDTTPFIKCLKMLLMIFIFVFLISGIAVLTIGIWMKVELYMYVELTTVYYSEAPYILIGVGSGIIIVAMLACFCTYKGQTVLLYFFCGFLVVVFIAELGIGTVGMIYKGKLQDGFAKGIDLAMSKYSKNGDKKEAMDGLQTALKCCGSANYTDWFHYKWDGAATKPFSVPESCCKEEGCDTTNLPPIMPQSADDLPVYSQGCYTLVTEFMEKNFLIVAGSALGFACLQLFGATLAYYLAKNINKNKYEAMA